MAKNKVLIVIDMQNDFIDGSLGTKEAVSVVSKVIEKIKGFEGKVYYTQDTHGEDYLETCEGRKLPVTHCIRGTKGHELHKAVDELRKRYSSEVFTKGTFGSVELAKALQHEYPDGPDEIECIGICTDICVISNALLLKAFFPESRIVVDASCCAGVTPKSHRNAIDAMKMCHIDIVNE